MLTVFALLLITINTVCGNARHHHESRSETDLQVGINAQGSEDVNSLKGASASFDQDLMLAAAGEAIETEVDNADTSIIPERKAKRKAKGKGKGKGKRKGKGKSKGRRDESNA